MPYRNRCIFARFMAGFIGETVTIFTTSGGESGDGFTGVLMGVNCEFVRLLVEIGPGPGCALGNPCMGRGRGPDFEDGDFEGDDFDEGDNRFGGFGRRRNGLGSVVDIPVYRIAAFVHNAV